MKNTPDRRQPQIHPVDLQVQQTITQAQQLIRQLDPNNKITVRFTDWTKFEAGGLIHDQPEDARRARQRLASGAPRCLVVTLESSDTQAHQVGRQLAQELPSDQVHLHPRTSLATRGMVLMFDGYMDIGKPQSRLVLIVEGPQLDHTGGTRKLASILPPRGRFT